MIALLTLTILFKSVFSLPVTESMLEHDDVKVMKCVVEALADVLSRPRHLPVSQECLHTLRTDDHLLTLLRHSNFLKELQEVATQGGDERARPPGGGAIAPHHKMPAPQNADGVPDGSMLNALGGSGERSIVSQEPRRSKEEEQKEEADKGGEDEKREDDDEREEEDSKVWTSAEQRRTVSEEEEEEEEGMKKRSKGFLLGKKSGSAEEEGEEEALHHSKEVSEEEEVKRKRNRSPEEKELQMIARRTPEEEDGSAARKSEDPEVESLAAIESELENVSQKLHQLRRG